MQKSVKIGGINIPYSVSVRKVKYSRIEIKDNKVHIVIPPWARDESKILKENAEWLHKHYSKIHHIINEEKFTYIFGEPWEINKSYEFTFDTPNKIISFNPNNKKHIAHTKRVLKSRLRKRIEESLSKYKKKYNFKSKGFQIRSQKTQWGNCTPENFMHFNIRMCVLPLDLIDYVVYHELVHTIHKNHGPNFKRQIEKEFPLHKSLDKKLHIFWARTNKLLPLLDIKV